jgi:hypothetical protein
VRRGGRRQSVRRRHVEAEGLLHRADAGVEQGAGRRTAQVVHDYVQPSEDVGRCPGEAAGGFWIRQVGGDDVRLAAGGHDLLGDGVQLALGTRGDDDVRTGLGERHRCGRADSAAGSGDHGDPVRQPEAVQDHALDRNTF